MTNRMTDEQNTRYQRALHRMQSAIALEIQVKGEASAANAKHLRVGLNSAFAEHAALAGLLIERGVITQEDYFDAIMREAEAEADRVVTLVIEGCHLPPNTSFA